MSRTQTDLNAVLREAIVGKPAQRLILLGAGASVEAGLPDGRELAKRFVESGGFPLLKRLLDRLAHAGSPDVERAFSVLDAIADVARPGSLMSDLSRLGLLNNSNNPARIRSEEAKSELVNIRRELRKQLWLPADFGSWVMDEVLKRPYEVPDLVSYLTPLVDASIGGTIASINYDNALELAGGRRVVVSGPSTRVVVPEEAPDKVRLLKLHGSLDWKRVNDDLIRHARPLEVTNYEPGVIFGAGNKLRHYGPFLDLLRAFSEKMRAASHLIVIGYGFRDQHINEAIRIWAQSASGDGFAKGLLICQGPDGVDMPEVVTPLQTLEHLRVELFPQAAADFIATMFGPGSRAVSAGTTDGAPLGSTPM